MPAPKGTVSHDPIVHPKLRMFCNGDSTVSTLRAESAASLSVSKKQCAHMQPMRGAEDVPVADGHAIKRKITAGLKSVTADAMVTVFVDLSEDADPATPLKGETGRTNNIATATLRLSELSEISARLDVRYIQLGEPLSRPVPELEMDAHKKPHSSLRRVANKRAHKGGKGVLIGIIDVQGFDFSHPDFLDDNGHTRFLKIWDQGGDSRLPPFASNGRSAYTYGAEFNQKDLNIALDAFENLTDDEKIPATEIERQSQQAEGSHGTHVASIAAGNLGVCPQADIAAVLIDLGDEDNDRRQSFYDSTRLAHAVSYLFDLADTLSKERGEFVPVSINVSLGTNGHAHDGSSPINRWIDAALTTPGRSVCVAAGNAGQEAPTQPGDTGFIMGRIHSSGKILAAGLSVDLLWQVVGNTIADISENEMEIWYGAQDRFSITLRSPSGQIIGPILPSEFVENRQLDSLAFVSVYSELYHPANGLNYIGIYLSPMMEATGIVGVEAGTWTIRLTGIDIREGTFHAWIERDDPDRVGQLGPKEAWRFPSFFSVQSNVDNTSISSLACGQNVLGIANLDSASETINASSSQGPTRDGRTKPEVAAPGTNIPAANGFGLEGEQWVSYTGTSMASPYAAGVVGLMLSVENKLTAAQIQGIIKRTAVPLPGQSFSWADGSGYGVIDAQACVHEASIALRRKDLKP